MVREGLVSVIVPVYNRPQLLAEALDSAIAQTYRPIEVLVVDDGSTDVTPEVARKYEEKHHGVVRYLRQVNEGPAAAKNAGVAAAAGEFIQFLDSDDLLAPEKLARQVGALGAHPECGVSYCFAREYPITSEKPSTPSRRTGTTFHELFPHILTGRIWPTSSPLYRRSVIDACGPFVRSARFEDWEFEARVASAHTRLHHCREFLTDVRRVHHIEGRGSRPAPLDAYRDSARIHELILGHARRAGLDSRQLDAFAPRIFAAGRECASKSLQPEAERCLDLAFALSQSTRRRLAIRAFRAASRLLGWTAAGKVTESFERNVTRPIRRLPSQTGRWAGAMRRRVIDRK